MYLIEVFTTKDFPALVGYIFEQELENFKQELSLKEGFYQIYPTDKGTAGDPVGSYYCTGSENLYKIGASGVHTFFKAWENDKNKYKYKSVVNFSRPVDAMCGEVGIIGNYLSIIPNQPDFSAKRAINNVNYEKLLADLKGRKFMETAIASPELAAGQMEIATGLQWEPIDKTYELQLDEKGNARVPEKIGFTAQTHAPQDPVPCIITMEFFYDFITLNGARLNRIDFAFETKDDYYCFFDISCYGNEF